MTSTLNDFKIKKSTEHIFKILLWRFQKNVHLPDRIKPPEVKRVFKDAPLKLKYVKIKKPILSIENSNISQCFLLDKLVSGQGLLRKKYFLSCYCLSKNRSKKLVGKKCYFKKKFLGNTPKTWFLF